MCDMTRSYVCVCCFVLLNRYWGIVTVPGSFLKTGDLGWPDPHPAPLLRRCDMTRSYEWHDSFIWVTWLVHMCDMTRSYVWHDSFICVIWLVHMCDITPHIFTNTTDSFFTDTTDSYVRHDVLISATWIIHMCAMTHSYVWRDSFTCVTWLIHI